MNWHKLDLKKELDRNRKMQPADTEEVLRAYRQLLKQDDIQDDNIAIALKKPKPQAELRALDAGKIYHSDEIKKLCTKYRLRLLSSRYFKSEIPAEAISRIKKLERDLQTGLSDFYILAPAPVFNLKDRDKDPVLFLALPNGYYYFIHKWGNDLSCWRSFLVFPFRNFTCLLGCVATLALLIVTLIPESLIIGPYDEHSFHLRVIFFFYLFIAFGGLTILYGFSRVKNFNGSLWNSPYLD